LNKNLPVVLLVIGLLLVVGAVVAVFFAPNFPTSAGVVPPALQPAAQQAGTSGQTGPVGVPGPTGLVDVGTAAPKTLAGFPMSASAVGAAALDGIQQLHSANIPLVSGVIAMYGDKSAMLWVAETASDADALKLVQAMEGSIAQGGSGYTTDGVFKFRNRDVYMMKTPNTSEFFMQAGKKVLWVSIFPEQAEKAMIEMLDYYP
jgi:hypothetical protein